MGGTFLTKRDLEPLLRGSWRGTRPAFTCLMVQAHLVGKAVRSVHKRSGGSDCPGYPEIKDLEHETLATLMERARSRHGLRLPGDWVPQQDLAPWLFRVVQNQARDLVRQRVARKREGGVIHVSIENAYDLGAEGGQGVVVVLIDIEKLYALVEKLIERGSPPTHALAWVLLRHPVMLRRELVERASIRDPRGHLDTVHGLAREPDETWKWLLEWAPRHHADPSGDESRRELAWILRSTDQQRPEAWRAGAPEEARKARDTLRKWENRFQERLQAVLEEEGKEG